MRRARSPDDSCCGLCSLSQFWQWLGYLDPYANSAARPPAVACTHDFEPYMMAYGLDRAALDADMKATMGMFWDYVIEAHLRHKKQSMSMISGAIAGSLSSEAQFARIQIVDKLTNALDNVIEGVHEAPAGLLLAVVAERCPGCLLRLLRAYDVRPLEKA